MTWSIIARDTTTGQIGIVVATKILCGGLGGCRISPPGFGGIRDPGRWSIRITGNRRRQTAAR